MIARQIMCLRRHFTLCSNLLGHHYQKYYIRQLAAKLVKVKSSADVANNVPPVLAVWSCYALHLVTWLLRLMVISSHFINRMP